MDIEIGHVIKVDFINSIDRGFGRDIKGPIEFIDPVYKDNVAYLYLTIVIE